MSHLVSENKLIYFLIRFAQTKITLFIFVNKWVIRENESFLLVGRALVYLRIGAIGEYRVKFLRLTTMILDYLRYTEFSRILLYEISLFIYLFIYLFFYLFICLFIYLFVLRAQAEFLAFT